MNTLDRLAAFKEGTGPYRTYLETKDRGVAYRLRLAAQHTARLADYTPRKLACAYPSAKARLEALARVEEVLSDLEALRQQLVLLQNKAGDL